MKSLNSRPEVCTLFYKQQARIIQFKSGHIHIHIYTFLNCVLRSLICLLCVGYTREDYLGLWLLVLGIFYSLNWAVNI